MSASTDKTDAQLDRIMEMSIEELAALDGQTVEEALEEGRRVKERVLARLSREFPDFVKRASK